MRTQQQVWEREHSKDNSIPSLSLSKPSSLVVSFIDYLKKQNFPINGKAIDIGCGKGRNSIFLAKKSFDVYAVDYIKEAVEITKRQAIKNGVVNRIHLFNQEIDNFWRFPDNFFDIAIDSFSSIDIETAGGRKIYKQELYRTLKPNGYALVTVVSVHDEIEKEMLKQHPGKEKNSTIWPQNNKFQKDYDEEELKEFYKDFKIVELKEIKKPAEKLSRKYIATNYWIVLQKLIM